MRFYGIVNFRGNLPTASKDDNFRPMNKSLATLLLFALLSVAQAELPIDESRSRDLETWKPQISKYSKYHYGESEWRLDPKVLILHYTVTEGFPWNLVITDTFRDEAPGLSVHYVVDGEKIWRILPDNVRTRGCYAINHVAINIEMVALDADDLAKRETTLKTCALLCQELMKKHDISIDKIYSHEQVGLMDPAVTPEALDLVKSTPYHKIDPGEQNMETILGYLKKWSQ